MDLMQPLELGPRADYIEQQQKSQSKMLALPLYIPLIIFIFGALYIFLHPGIMSGRVSPGVAAPDFVASDKLGSPVRLSDFAGRVIVINFWSTSNQSSVDSMPNLNALAAAYRSQGVVFLSIHVNDKKEAFDNWVSEHPQFGSMFFAADNNNTVSKLYNLNTVPAQCIIGRDGLVIKSLEGYDGTFDKLEGAIKEGTAAKVSQ